MENELASNIKSSVESTTILVTSFPSCIHRSRFLLANEAKAKPYPSLVVLELFLTPPNTPQFSKRFGNGII